MKFDKSDNLLQVGLYTSFLDINCCYTLKEVEHFYYYKPHSWNSASLPTILNIKIEWQTEAKYKLTKLLKNLDYDSDTQKYQHFFGCILKV